MIVWSSVLAPEMIDPALGIRARCLTKSKDLDPFRRRGRTLSSSFTHRSLQTQQFQPFTPPSLSSLGKATPAKTYRQTRRWARRLFYLAFGTGVIYVLDRQYYASSITRSARTFGLGLFVALDYKINFRANPPLAPSIAALHARSAERLADLLKANGGLYLKIGQAIAMQSAVLPLEFQKIFAKMFDDAPQNSWKDVEQVIREEWGNLRKRCSGSASAEIQTRELWKGPQEQVLVWPKSTGQDCRMAMRLQ